MGTILFAITGSVYAAFVVTAALFRGVAGFIIWLVLALGAIAYLKITMQASNGEVISNTWLISPAIVGFVVGLAVHFLRVVTRNNVLPLILIFVGPLLIVHDFGILDWIDKMVRSF